MAAKNEKTKTEPVKNGRTKPEPAKTAKAKPEQAKTVKAKPEPAKTAKAKPEPAKTTKAKPEQAKAVNGKQESAKNDKEDRKPRKKSLPLTVLKILAGAAIVLAILFSVSTLKTVTVEDNVLYDQSEIADTILNDEYTWNTLYVYVKYLFREPQALPFVESLDIRLTGLHSISVHVNSKDLAGYIFVSSLNRNVYFDGNGKVVEISDKIVEGIPQITGTECETAVQGMDLEVNSSIRKGMLSLLQTLERKKLIPDEIRYGEADSPVLILGNVRISLGDTTQLTQKIERAAAIYPQISDKSGVLHLEDWNDSSSSIIFSQDEGSGAADTQVGESETTDSQDAESGRNASDDGTDDADAQADDAADAEGIAAEGAADGTADGTVNQ